MRVAVGQAMRWTASRRFWIGAAGGEAAAGRFYAVEASRAYRDRLVLKLVGIDHATTAAGLRGQHVSVPGEEAPALGAAEWYAADLVGLEVLTLEDGRRLGRVEDVLPTGGTDLLRVRRESGGELLIPMAREILCDVSLDEGRIRVKLPWGLEQLDDTSGKSGG